MPKTITQYVETARQTLAGIDQQLERLARERELEAARLEAFEQVAGVSHTIRDPRAPAPVSAPRQHTIHAAPPLTIKRAPAGAWRGVFRKLLGREQFTYDDVVEVATSLGIEASKPSSRVRVSKFKDSGYLDRVEEGIYKVTPEGKKFFEGN